MPKRICNGLQNPKRKGVMFTYVSVLYSTRQCDQIGGGGEDKILELKQHGLESKLNPWVSKSLCFFEHSFAHM